MFILSHISKSKTAIYVLIGDSNTYLSILPYDHFAVFQSIVICCLNGMDGQQETNNSELRTI